MPLFTKNGSIPKPQIDDTPGWVLVPDEPQCPEGKEVVWLNWSWVIRDPKPEDREGYRWKWNHSQMEWIEYEIPSLTGNNTNVVIESLSTDQIDMLTTSQMSALSNA